MGVISRDEPVATAATYSRCAPAVDDDGEVHMLVCALDYKRTRRPLTCTMDGQNIVELAQACGVDDLCCMWDEECTKESVEQRIREMGARCDANDYFIFYYAGHGTNIKDVDGDEEDGKDEALCLVDANTGKFSAKTVMLDEVLAEIICDAVPALTRVLIICDCCHSGTIGDLDRRCWNGREAISISGCEDTETSGDTGTGGIFTHSLLLAIQKLSDAGEDDYSVGLLYNATLSEDENVFNSAQHITMSCAPAVSPDSMAWPLIPLEDYESPMSRAAQGGFSNIASGVMAHVTDLAAATGAEDAAFVEHLRRPADYLHVPVVFLAIVCLYLIAVVLGLCIVSIFHKVRVVALFVLLTLPCFCIFLCIKGPANTKRLVRDIKVLKHSRGL